MVGSNKEPFKIHVVSCYVMLFSAMFCSVLFSYVMSCDAILLISRRSSKINGWDFIIEAIIQFHEHKNDAGEIIVQVYFGSVF